MFDGGWLQSQALIAEVRVRQRAGEVLTIDEMSRRYIVQAERRGRKLSTRANVESAPRRRR